MGSQNEDVARSSINPNIRTESLQRGPFPDEPSKAEQILEKDIPLSRLSQGGEAIYPPSSLGSVWEKVSADLAKSVDVQLYSAWLKPLSIKEIRISSHGPIVPGTVVKRSSFSTPSVAHVVLKAPNKFAVEHLRKNFLEQLQRSIGKVIDVTAVILAFVVDMEIRSSAPAVERAVRKPSRARSANEGNLNPKYNFSNFVVGSCNQFAHAACLQVAENLGETYNPLFIYGGVGLGKTHLVNAIGNASIRRGKNVLLISSEAFVNELITALRGNRMQQFKTKFRSLDLLIIDDVQFMVGKERTQEEFFHTFNELHQRHRQIILTSDKLPRDLTGLEERLRTRFASGLSTGLQAPDFETRVAILSNKADGFGVSLPGDVTEFIAEEIDTNVRELEGVLTRLVALSQLHKEPFTLDLAHQAVRGFTAKPSKPDLSTEFIQRFVAEKYSVSISDLLGKRRTQNIALARQVAMYLCRRLTGCSFPEIGALFGGRDHSTVIHACRVIEERGGEDRKFRDEMVNLEDNLTN